MKTILVTGSAGFIGSNLCLKLLKENKDCIVIGIDNYYSGQKKNTNEIKKLYPDRFIFIDQDICELNCNDFQYKINEIYNAACPASPIFYQNEPIETIKVNTIGIMNLLELAKRDSSKLLQFSTSEVYGNPLIHPQPEYYFGNVNPNGIRSCYDEGKRISETLCLEYNRKYGLKISIVRIFNTYGPRMRADDGRVISNFIIQCLKDKQLTVYGDGTQTRSFCYIDDLLDGIIKLMASDEIYPVNLGNPTEFSLNELILELESIFNKKLVCNYMELPQDDPERRKPDISKAINILHWYPNIDLKYGLLKTIEYFKKEL